MAEFTQVASRRRFLVRFGSLAVAGFAVPLLQACSQAPAPAAAPTTAPAAAKPATAPTSAPQPTVAAAAAPKPTTAAAQPAAAAATTAPAAAATTAPATGAAAPATDAQWDDLWKKAGAPYQGVTLRLPVGGRGHWGANEEASKVFEQLTGIKSIWENISDAQLFDKLFLDLTSHAGAYDLVPLNYGWFSSFMSGNHLEGVDKYLKDERFPKIDMSIFVPALVDTYTVWEGTQYGLPWLGDAMILPYNTEHFKAAGLDPETPPTSWEQVVEFGKKLTKGDQYGFSLMGGRQVQAMCTYSAILFSYGKNFYDDSGKPQFASAEGIKAMNIINDLVPISPPSAKTWEIDQAAEAVAQGGVSMEIQWPGILASLIDPAKSKVIGKMAFGPPPVRGPLGGWGIAISSWSKNKEAAWLMMNYLTTVRIQREYAPRGYAITAASLFQDPSMEKVYPYAKPFGQALGIGIAWPRTADSQDVNTIMAKHVNAVVVGDEKPEDGAKAMNQEVEDLRRERGLIKS
jgi:multiple sugar transport system substrate-binding protein